MFLSKAATVTVYGQEYRSSVMIHH